MKKKVIFLDGDGTLWYPKATKRAKKPHWVYHDPQTRDNFLEHLELTPGTKAALETLKGRGMRLVLISASPHAETIARQELKQKLEYFSLDTVIHSYYASDGNDPAGKGIVMTRVIASLGMVKEAVVMVGDSYFYDYAAARNGGVDAFFIENDSARMPDTVPTDLRTIKEVSDLVTLLD
jgi:phosphoglycolate phosphatase-like HAD superfamily hydrolase